MSTLKQIIKRARGKRPQSNIPTMSVGIANARYRQYQNQLWEKDKQVVREHNFNRMKAGLVKYREAQEREKERQEEIAAQRLKNLAKARKAKARNK